jgi:hypothetical protein
MQLKVPLAFDPRRLDSHANLVARLTDIYTEMDRCYQLVADHYGFNCTGCEDNCCHSLFFHHTLVEYGHLRKGFRTLAPAVQRELKRRARQYAQQIPHAAFKQTAPRPICPLNDNSQCLLYAFRPMICRLHGLPHEIRRPGSSAVVGRGCHVFGEQCGTDVNLRLNRTPLYGQMASLEMTLRQTLGSNPKIKMTVADMLCTFEPACER